MSLNSNSQQNNSQNSINGKVIQDNYKRNDKQNKQNNNNNLLSTELEINQALDSDQLQQQNSCSSYSDDESLSEYNLDENCDNQTEKAKQKEQEKTLKRKKKAQKKYKLRKKHQLYENRSSDDEKKIEERIRNSSIWTNENIPEKYKEKMVKIENDPLCLIVANIPISITTFELKEYFSTLVRTLNPNIQQPVQDVKIGETKNYAIIKFNNKQSLMVMSELSNLEYKQYKLKLKKPKGFFQRLYAKANDRYDPYGNIITSTSDVDHTLYMGGLPLYLKEEEVRKLCESFGILRYFNLIKERSGDEYVSKGYCFFEYQDPLQTDKAIEGLNQLYIGDNKLKVSRASRTEGVMPKQTEEQREQLKKEGKLVKEKKNASNSTGSFLGNYGRIADPLIQILLNIPQSARTASKVVQFLNMCTPDDLIDDQFYQQLYNDIGTECSQFGVISQIQIQRPDPQSGKAGPAVGKVFVKFQYMISAKRAQSQLAGRIYNNKTVITSFYNEDSFAAQQYLTQI